MSNLNKPESWHQSIIDLCHSVNVCRSISWHWGFMLYCRYFSLKAWHIFGVWVWCCFCLFFILCFSSFWQVLPSYFPFCCPSPFFASIFLFLCFSSFSNPSSLHLHFSISPPKLHPAIISSISLRLSIFKKIKLHFICLILLYSPVTAHILTVGWHNIFDCLALWLWLSCSVCGPEVTVQSVYMLCVCGWLYWQMMRSW